MIKPHRHHFVVNGEDVISGWSEFEDTEHGLTHMHRGAVLPLCFLAPILGEEETHAHIVEGPFGQAPRFASPEPVLTRD